jgi:hypothetical protein
LVAAEIDAIGKGRKRVFRGMFPSLDHPARLRYAGDMRSPTLSSHSNRPENPSPAQAREDRLKAALKANMTRRKAQAKARLAKDGETGETDNNG